MGCRILSLHKNCFHDIKSFTENTQDLKDEQYPRKKVQAAKPNKKKIFDSGFFEEIIKKTLKLINKQFKNV